MSDLQGLHLLPDEFNGVVRLFPLPDVVVFPHIVQALHIFEPRYREMLEDALSRDRLIAMALLAPGWEQDYGGRPPIHDIVCIGRIISHSPMGCGQYNVLLLGLRRARVIYELPPQRCFREAHVEVLDDVYPPDGQTVRAKRQRRLMNRFRRIVPKHSAARQQLEQLLGAKIPLGILTDLVAYSLDVDMEQKHRLLSEVNVDRRAESLLEELDRPRAPSAALAPSRFPPQFSAN